ncbi:hypothetical protein [Desulfolutivibrio sp.]|jgi:cytochrome bd-type quinol oxidase subunit 1
MRKRIADALEKMAVGCLVGALFQTNLYAFFIGAVLMGLCLFLTGRIER